MVHGKLGRMIGRGQHRVERCHHLRPVPDGGGNALDRSGPHIADGKNAPAARFQEKPIVAGLGTGQHKAFFVQGDTGPAQPIRVRFRADEKKKMTNGALAPPFPNSR